MTKAESKKRIHELYEKHYGKGRKKKSKAVKQKEFIVEKATTEQKPLAEKRNQNRADLMAQVKEKGIKNFRVLNKDELLKVLDPMAAEEVIAEEVQGAVARWKSGWGKKGGRSATISGI